MLSQWLYTLILITAVCQFSNGILVSTANGTIQGSRCASSDSNYFLGIPFADPPVGSLRYQPAQSFSGSYNGTLDGTIAAPICRQFGPANIQIGLESEDCLYLNVYTPANATATSKLPVKLWIYGGGFVTGGSTASSYDGCYASQDVIIVTINYRLGPLGYLAVENTPISGNYGASDQLQALRWVHDNIAAFGGDSVGVDALVLSSPAGAMSSFGLATLPEIKSLIRAVVMESGGGYDYPIIKTSYAFNANLIDALNCTASDVDCIRSKSPEHWNATYNERLNKSDALSFAYTPLDRSRAIFPWGPVAGSPMYPIQPSQIGVQVPAIFGSNGLEGSIFILQTFTSKGLPLLNETVYEDFLEVNYGPFAPNVSLQYPLSSFNNDTFKAMSVVVRDFAFRCSARRGALRAAAKGISVWTYNFNQTVSCPWSQDVPASDLQRLGAAHTAEIIFSFGETTNLPLPNGNCTLSPGEANISAYMQSSWMSMAESAQPGDAWPSFFPNSTMGVNLEDGMVLPGLVDYTMCHF